MSLWCIFDNGTSARIFSCVRPVYEWAVSDLDRPMHWSLWALVAHSSYTEGSHTTKNTASEFIGWVKCQIGYCCYKRVWIPHSLIFKSCISPKFAKFACKQTFVGGYAVQLCGAFLRKEGWIQVLAGKALSIQTVAFFLRTPWACTITFFTVVIYRFVCPWQAFPA